MSDTKKAAKPQPDIKAWVEQSRAAQGLPPRIEDQAVLAQLARILSTP